MREEFTKVHATALLNALLFRDNAGNAYGDDCAQNRIVKKIASNFGIEIDLKAKSQDEHSEKAREKFGNAME